MKNAHTNASINEFQKLNNPALVFNWVLFFNSEFVFFQQGLFRPYIKINYVDRTL